MHGSLIKIRPLNSGYSRRGEPCVRPGLPHNAGDHTNMGDHKDRPYGTLPGTGGRVLQFGMVRKAHPTFEESQRNVFDKNVSTVYISITLP